MRGETPCLGDLPNVYLSSLNALESISFVTAALDAGEVSVDRGFIVINDPGSE